jgi:hypothetical protein
LAGALSGTASIPKEWIEQVEYATTQNPFTNSKRTMLEQAEGLYGAYLNRFKKARALAEMMGV